MSDNIEGPNRRTVIAGVAVAGVAWTVPVVLSGSPAAAQASGCALISVTPTPVCTGNPSFPFGIEFSISVVGCVGSYAVEILQGGSTLACFALPPGGGSVRGTNGTPLTDVPYTFRLREGAPCVGTVINSVDIVASTPSECPPPGAPVDGVIADAQLPTFPLGH